LKITNLSCLFYMMTPLVLKGSRLGQEYVL
jgi:hypothetical protein